MAKANLFGLFDKYQANLSRNGFSNNQDYYFSAAPGMMLPVFHRLMNPNETEYLTIAGNTVCLPMIKPTMCDIVQKIDVFFVPLTKIWTPFASVFADTNDSLSSSVIPSDFSLPLLNLEDIAISLSDDVGSALRFFNRNYFYTEADASVRYGTFFDAFRLSMHLGVNPFNLYAFADDVTLPTNHIEQLTHFKPSFFPYQFAAYQCIYNDWYRDDDREPRKLESYQLDVFTSQFDNKIELADLPSARGLLCLRYHQRPKDYFTSLRVSPITSTLNSLSSSSADTANYGRSLLDSYLSGALPSARNSSGAVFSDDQNNKRLTQYGTSPTSNFTSASIRSIFAVEKFMRIYGRAKKNYDSQVLAHFGASVPRDVKHDISYLGSFGGNIGVSTIYSQANTSNGDAGSPLGERAGSGKGQLGGKTIKFTAPCHGVLMAIYYAVPHASYTQGFVQDKRNFLSTIKDFYHPEFDRLGDQPLYAYEIGYMHSGGGNVSSFQLGWQRRYMQWKTTFDRHSIAFRPRSFATGTNDWSPWVVSYEVPFSDFDVVGDIGALTDITPSFVSFFVRPDMLNTYFHVSYWPDLTTEQAVAYMQSPWLMFQHDPFMVALNINEKYISTMSTTGEPSLDSMF